MEGSAWRGREPTCQACCVDSGDRAGRTIWKQMRSNRSHGRLGVSKRIGKVVVVVVKRGNRNELRDLAGLEGLLYAGHEGLSTRTLSSRGSLELSGCGWRRLRALLNFCCQSSQGSSNCVLCLVGGADGGRCRYLRRDERSLRLDLLMPEMVGCKDDGLRLHMPYRDRCDRSLRHYTPLFPLLRGLPPPEQEGASEVKSTLTAAFACCVLALFVAPTCPPLPSTTHPLPLAAIHCHWLPLAAMDCHGLPWTAEAALPSSRSLVVAPFRLAPRRQWGLSSAVPQDFVRLRLVGNKASDRLHPDTTYEFTLGAVRGLSSFCNRAASKGTFVSLDARPSCCNARYHPVCRPCYWPSAGRCPLRGLVSTVHKRAGANFVSGCPLYCGHQTLSARHFLFLYSQRFLPSPISFPFLTSSCPRSLSPAESVFFPACPLFYGDSARPKLTLSSWRLLRGKCSMIPR